jgi:hypothetical protein
MTRSLAVGLWFTLFCGPALAFAQDNVQARPQPGREVGTPTDVRRPEGEEEKAWTFEGDFSFYSAYLFRGYNNVDTGYIFQPELTVTRHVGINDQLSLDIYASAWSNIAEDTPKTSGPRHWNEFDGTFGVGFNFLEKWSLAVEYLYYMSPANDFDDVHEIGVILAYDHWLAPAIGYYREIDDRNGDEDTYLEVKLEPALPKITAIPLLEKLELSVPMVLGMSLDGYYLGADGHNAFFGYASIGLSASYPITDHWSVVGGVEYHHLFADNIEDLNSDSDYKVVGRIGVAFEY